MALVFFHKVHTKIEVFVQLHSFRCLGYEGEELVLGSGSIQAESQSAVFNQLSIQTTSSVPHTGLSTH